MVKESLNFKVEKSESLYSYPAFSKKVNSLCSLLNSLQCTASIKPLAFHIFKNKDKNKKRNVRACEMSQTEDE